MPKKVTALAQEIKANMPSDIAQQAHDKTLQLFNTIGKDEIPETQYDAIIKKCEDAPWSTMTINWLGLYVGQVLNGWA